MPMLTLIAVRAIDEVVIYEEEHFEGTLEQARTHWLARMRLLQIPFGQVLGRDGVVRLNLSSWPLLTAPTEGAV